jgi:hypothetical protein
LGFGFGEIINPQGLGFGGGCCPQNPCHEPVEGSEFDIQGFREILNLSK